MSQSKCKSMKSTLKYSMVALPLILGVNCARAETLTAGVALDTMSSVEFSSYIQGIVEGLAQARYEKDGRNTDGMRCIYDWFYESGDASLRDVIGGFEKFASHSPGAVMSGLINRECPS